MIRPKLIQTVYRGLFLRCPVCGRSSIIQSPFHIKHHCPSCSALFMREVGFFVGAIMVNVVATDFAIVALYLFGVLAVGADFENVLVALFAFALVFPIAFYHHSWSLWLAFDHLVETLPRHDQS
jgi:uncharacterized protein (DUF983 family)